MVSDVTGSYEFDKDKITIVPDDNFVFTQDVAFHCVFVSKYFFGKMFSIFEWNDAPSDSEDEEFVAFPRQRKVIRSSPDHFTLRREQGFVDRFRLSKDTVRFVLNLMPERCVSLS